MVGIKDVAKAANVSISTVSNVLNGRKNVGEDTREKVLQMCSDLGYKPNIFGKTLKTGSLNTIVFNFSDFKRSFYLKIIEGISDYLTENNYDLIICTNKSSESFMNGSFASGAISLDGQMSEDFFHTIANQDFPIVLMDREINNEHTKSVVVDNYPVMCNLVQSLVDKGYASFGFIGGMDTLDNQERYSAFIHTLEKNNIVFDTNYLFHGDFREASGYQAARIFILSNNLPEVLVCANDNMAYGAIRALKENGYKVPEDIGVTGFDDSALAEMAGLTTISIPRYESGYLAAKELVEMINGKKDRNPFKINASVKWRSTTK